MHGKELGYGTIRVKSPDTDVFFLLLHFASKIDGVTILFDTGTGNKKRLINVSELASDMSELHTEALLSLHAFTGCDSTSSFKGIGKLKPLKVLAKMNTFEETLAKLGSSWDLSPELIDEMDALTCAIYGRTNIKHVDELRYMKLSKLGSEGQLSAASNIDMSNIPPCRKSLEQHIRRVNYQVAIWKQSCDPNPAVPDASDGHGWSLIDGKIEPLWFDGDALPQELIDIEANLAKGNSDDDSDDSDDSETEDNAPIYEDSDDE